MVVRRKLRAPKRMFKRRKAYKLARSGASQAMKYQYHKYKRYCQPVHFYNTNPTGTADLVIDVNGTSFGKNWVNGVQLGPLIAGLNNTSSIGGSINLQAQMLENILDFDTLYDKYKVSGYKVTILPQQNMAVSSSNTVLPTITYAFDQDDSNVPVSQAQLLQYGNAKVRRLDKPVSFYIKPKVGVSVFSFSGAAQTVTSSKYIDWANTDVPHRGVKFWIENMNLVGAAGLTHLYKIVIKAYLTNSQTR